MTTSQCAGQASDRRCWACDGVGFVWVIGDRQPCYECHFGNGESKPEVVTMEEAKAKLEGFRLLAKEPLVICCSEWP